ncbi:phage holin family protein [Clostridium thermosuccinogenes]|uniref:phage holin family protein n=1 Tax=Clostridium thermosuccinogenes TaxID=84032 RepID=UPI000CCBF4BE|nr:phage holin family protein [Pseudoclostridium thermosuccinogenes]PNT94137.1 hypothetical protein CDQ83_11860 [Pseudoclostridium thermosuccinogenes]
MDKSTQVLTWIKLVGATICTVLSNLLGGWDTALQVLLVFTLIDIITGILKAIYNKDLSSGIAYKGAIKKVGIYLIVAVACKLDEYMQTNFIRTFVIGYYIATEGISITENLGVCGVPLPAFVKNILQQLKDSSDKGKQEVNKNV